MKGIMIHTERCNGCLTCVLACAAVHSASNSITGAMAEGVPGRIFIQAVDCRPVPVLCRHCAEPACVQACMAGAMRKDAATGLVTNEGSEQTCAGCWMCIMACPYGAIVPDPGPEQRAVKCDGCPGRELPACVAACPNKALEYADPAEYALHRRQATARDQADEAGEVQ